MPRAKKSAPKADLEPVVETASEEAPSVEEAEPAPVQAKEPVDTRPRFTARQVFRGDPNPLAKAFLHVEGLNQKRTRKLPRDEWLAEFEAFRQADRR